MFMRWTEGRLVRVVEAWCQRSGSSGLDSRSGDGGDMRVRRFVKDVEVEGQAKRSGSGSEGAAGLGSEVGGIVRWVWERIRRS